MTILYEERTSDSPFIESILHGYTLSAGSSIRPAESHWHMVFSRYAGRIHPIYVGPWTTEGETSWGEGAEILWIKFKLGVFMRKLPPANFVDRETVLPEAGSQSFWLNGSAWQFPDFENVETFVDMLAREEVLAHDPIVEAVLQGQQPEIAPRTLRHRFLQATGLAHGRIYQIERAQRAAALLESGVPILEAVAELGYYDQPHLTRSLKRFIGYTPAQLASARLR
jgi:AraC-like DNA-binding protein